MKRRMVSILIILVLLLLSMGSGAEGGGANCTLESSECQPGVILPVWMPQDGLSMGDTFGRAFVYLCGIFYVFLGLSIVADRFMASIEVITSQEREITIHRSDGSTVNLTVRIWNETVSNLTLMALGSSAPEILLSVIEVCGHGFQAGALGPNTIVGSAAFNLFMIIAICVFVIPNGEVSYVEIRRQKHLSVFFVTASMSIFAYAWLYIILAVSSYGRIEVWEGMITLLFFPMTVLGAYIADTKFLVNRFKNKAYRASARGIIATEGGESELQPMNGIEQKPGTLPPQLVDPVAKAAEDQRQQAVSLIKELRQRHPDLSNEDLAVMVEVELVKREPKSRAFYRVQASKKLTGGESNIVRKRIEENRSKDEKAALLSNAANENDEQRMITIEFNPDRYTVLENVGTVNLIVSCRGGAEPEQQSIILVDYHTEDGSANAGGDYVADQGTLIFHPRQNIPSQQKIPIEIIDDDVFEEDEYFTVHLSNVRLKTRNGLVIDPKQMSEIPPIALGESSTATVMILDDDHAGVFSFEKNVIEVPESAGCVNVRIQRRCGARGKVVLPYYTLDGTARGYRDYQVSEGEVIFENDEFEKFIEINVVDREEYERREFFTIVLGEPIWAKRLTS